MRFLNELVFPMPLSFFILCLGIMNMLMSAYYIPMSPMVMFTYALSELFGGVLVTYFGAFQPNKVWQWICYILGTIGMVRSVFIGV